MAAQMRSVERFSFTARCCYSMVRALSAVIVMAESVSGSYLTDALAFLKDAIRVLGRSRRTETSLGSITSVRREAFAWIVPRVRIGSLSRSGVDASSDPRLPVRLRNTETLWAAPHPTAFGDRPSATASAVRRAVTCAPFNHIGART
jgi:hypothetical protein